MSVSIDVNTNRSGARGGYRPGLKRRMLQRVRTVGARVRAARELRGLGYNELDRAIGKQPGYTSRLESSNRAPRADTLERLAAVLRVRIEYLVRGEEPMERPAERWIEAESRYPNLAAAIARKLAAGKISEATADAARTWALHAPADLDEDLWGMNLDQLEHRLRTARALPQDDDAPPAAKRKRG